MSLIIVITNNKTGTNQAANYSYEVRVNSAVIESGHIENHDRSQGWKNLVRMLLDDSVQDEPPAALEKRYDEMLKKLREKK